MQEMQKLRISYMPRLQGIIPFTDTASRLGTAGCLIAALTLLDISSWCI